MTKVNGKQVKLAEADASYEVARQRWLEIHASTRRTTDPLPVTVADVLEEFLEHVQTNLEPATYRWHLTYLRRFHARIGDRLLIRDLKPFHVSRWLDDEFAGASNNQRRAVITSVKRAIAWAAEQGIITASPIATIKRPTYEPATDYLTEDQFTEVMGHINVQCFRDYLQFLWHTGCRPQEIRVIEADHFDGERIVLPRRLAKGKKHERVIYLNSEALEIITRLVALYPTGVLFRNSRGGPWTANAVRSRFKRLNLKVKAKTLRHCFITDGIKRGVDSTTVSVLTGHRDPTMVQRNYQHLADDAAYLATQAGLVRDGGTA